MAGEDGGVVELRAAPVQIVVRGLVLGAVIVAVSAALLGHWPGVAAGAIGAALSQGHAWLWDWRHFVSLHPDQLVLVSVDMPTRRLRHEALRREDVLGITTRQRLGRRIVVQTQAGDRQLRFPRAGVVARDPQFDTKLSRLRDWHASSGH